MRLFLSHGALSFALMAGSAGAALSRSRVRGLVIGGGLFLLAGAAWMVLRGR